MNTAPQTDNVFCIEYSPSLHLLVDALDRLLGGPWDFDLEATRAQALEKARETSARNKAASKKRQAKARENQGGRIKLTLEDLP